MNVRAQMVMSFHLDKCIGCHTCSVSCKNIWTTRKGAEYMWWNNVETKPGTGYPLAWEDQDRYNGGWEVRNGKLKLKLLKGPGKVRSLLNIFFQPNLPTIDDYYEPFTYDYENLFNAEEGENQPVARPKSLVTGQYMDKINLGPNWDDDLGGSPIYAQNDPNWSKLSENHDGLEEIPDQQQQEILSNLDQLFFFYVPRICNHCLNPGCVASCPSGAIYKRGEDGIVLIDQETCRGWRYCVSACPYKKPYYNWNTGKSEKCIFCYPRVETAQANACAHSCVGRIRYVGPVLYDADKIEETAKVTDHELVTKHRDAILDPTDPEVREAARANDVDDSMLEAAQDSPCYKMFKKWEIALPHHPEFRTVPMTFYVPPLSPMLLTKDYAPTSTEFFNDIEDMRVPLEYLANLLSAGNKEQVKKSLKKQMAVRMYRRQEQVGDVGEGKVRDALREAELTEEDAEEIYRLFSLASYDERFVIPEQQREDKSAEDLEREFEVRGTVGFGTDSNIRMDQYKRGP